MLIIGICFGFPLGIFFVYLIGYIKTKKLFKSIESVFTNILNNFSKVSFNKRINQYVYLKFGNYELIYMLDTKEIHIFENEKCVYTSTQILGSEVINKLENRILEKWNNDINDVININNAIISVNTMKREFRNLGVNDEDINYILSQRKEIEEEIVYNLDEILDKINQVGYDKLSNEEKEFLKNISK
jgi:hypothetical protein